MGARDRARGELIDAWLARGGTVLAANERAARSVTAAFHGARQAEGRTAWRTPPVFAWENWVRERWLERNHRGLMLLNPLQEQTLWARVIGNSHTGTVLLHPGRLAAAAQRAYQLLCWYAPDPLKPSFRTGWTGDASTLSEWMEEFESHCRREGLESNSRLALELAEELRRESMSLKPDEIQRPGLLLIGFDRLLETQVALLDAWGEWRVDASGTAAQSAQFVAASDAAAEVRACVNWLRARLSADPTARLIVVTTALDERRGALERELLEVPRQDGMELDFEFSLGVSLGLVSLARSAILLLRWLHEPITEAELDWLLGSSHCAASAAEEIALAETMRELRRRGKERPDWELEDFAHATASPYRSFGPFSDRISGSESGYALWAARLLMVRDQLSAVPQRQSPLEWVGVAGQLLESAGWPGFRPLSSVAFQARQRWDRVLEACGSLGFDGLGMGWAEFVSTLSEAANSTIFAAESWDARVQITEPLESAGQMADGIWFLGANEENWPGRGQPHPLLPIGLQRDREMPHASLQADWRLAQEATQRLLASADEVIFSYARQSVDAEARPSRLVVQLVGSAEDLDEESSQAENGSDLTEIVEDWSWIPFPHGEIGGGAATLTRQSLCPFQAFGIARLNADDWEPAEAGLNARQRGQLLHSVLHRVWGGFAQGGISSLAELKAVPDLRQFAGRIVRTVMSESFDPQGRNSLPARFPERYLELEAERLTGLVSEWLDYERERLPFVVLETEVTSEVTVAGLKLRLRLDRIDEVQNGGRLVIDYKGSEVGPKAWTGERPDDVQLPLYATFAVTEDLEGLVFARVRPAHAKFYGRVRDASASLLPGLSGRDLLVKDPLTERQLEEWRERIERLGEDFLAGRSDVDPKDPMKTCGACHLHAVCRIYENPPITSVPEEDEDTGEDGEGAGGGDA